jgi:hypothetical protein
MKRKLRRHSDGVRKKVSVYLLPEQSRRLEEIAKQRASSSSAVMAEMIRGAIEATGSSDAPLDGVEKSIALILNRLSKLERIQRTLVLNTAYARGHAIGVLRSTPAETRKIIEQEMSKNFAEQKEFFFSLYPDQLEGDRKEEKS